MLTDGNAKMLESQAREHMASLVDLLFGEARQLYCKAMAMDSEADQRDAPIQLQDEILISISRAAREDLLNEVNRTHALAPLTLRL